MAGQPNPYQPYSQAPPPPPGIGGNYPRGAYQGPPPDAAFQQAYPQPYGTPSPYGHAYPNTGVVPGLVTAGFIMALIPCTSWPGLIMCAIGMGEAKKRQAGAGMALAGIVIGLVWQVLGVVFYVALAVADASGSF